jgi:hypothetical protein
MVTLIGFMFILGNVALMAFMVPDLVGPVSFDVDDGRWWRRADDDDVGT